MQRTLSRLATHPNPPYNSSNFSNFILTMSNKTIAKNTLFLYIRMLFNMGAMLYISRVVLQVLGVEDFGIYNIVMGGGSPIFFF